MKKPILTSILTVLFVFTFISSHAQTFGVKAGYNLSTYNIDQSTLEYGMSIHQKPGFHLGLNFGLDITKNLSLESLLSFNSKGIKTTYVDPKFDADNETKTRMYYLDLPIGVKYKFPIGDLNLFAIAGGYVGTGLFGKTKYKDNTPVDETALLQVVKEYELPIIFGENTNRLDYGMMYGVGIEYKLISLSFQHLIGMADIQKGSDTQHRMLQVSLGYTFRHQAY